MRNLGTLAMVLVLAGALAFGATIYMKPGSSIVVANGTRVDSAKVDTSAWYIPAVNPLTNTLLDAMLAFRHTAKGVPNPLCTLSVQYKYGGVDSLYKNVDIKLLADSTETFHFFLLNLDSLRPDAFRLFNKAWRDSHKVYEVLECK